MSLMHELLEDSWLTLPVDLRCSLVEQAAIPPRGKRGEVKARFWP
jgi:hypothetical protein